MAYRWNKTVDELKKQDEMRKEIRTLVAKHGSIIAFATNSGLSSSWVGKLINGDQRITDDAMDRVRKSSRFI